MSEVKIPLSAISGTIEILLRAEAHQAIKYVHPKLTVKATRKHYKHSRKTDPVEIILTMGRPNYAERKFIKLCVKAGEPFPIKKIQLKFLKKK